MMVCELQGLAQWTDWFPFADLSTANEKIKLLCVLCLCGEKFKWLRVLPRHEVKNLSLLDAKRQENQQQ
jgi:hypothetical protein